MASIQYDSNPLSNACPPLLGKTAITRIAICTILPLVLSIPAGATPSTAMLQIQPPLGQAITEQAKVDTVLQWHQIAQRAANGRWQLAQANLKSCNKLRPSFGMSLHESRSFPPDYRDTAMQAFELQSGRPAIWAVASGGPADWAGLRVGDIVIAVNGSDTSAGEHASDVDPVQRTRTLLDAVPDRQVATLTIARAGILMGFSLVPQSICSGSFDTSAADEIALLANGKPDIAGLDTANDEELAKRFIRLTSPPPTPAAPTSAPVKALKSGATKVSKPGKGRADRHPGERGN